MKALIFLGFLAMTVPALANHPGDELDEVMAKKEPAFEPTDLRSMPNLALTNGQGATLTLHDLQESIVVLSFVPRNCGSACALQQGLLAAVQKQINITPMKQMVTFLTIHDCGVPIGVQWDQANWRSATPTSGTVAENARSFTALSDRNPTTPLVHIIGRGSRHAGLFHGSAFRQINVVLYINGLANAHSDADRSEPDTFWDSIKKLFK